MKSQRNIPLLAASILLIGVAEEYLSHRILAYNLPVVQKTLLIMAAIAIGFTFAAGFLEPLARRSLHILSKPFKRLAGNTGGMLLFYLLIYATLFILYLVVFIYEIY